MSTIIAAIAVIITGAGILLLLAWTASTLVERNEDAKKGRK